MTARRSWHQDDDGQIIIPFNLLELHTIIGSLRTVCYNMLPEELEVRIGRTQQEIETLLKELLAIADTVEPPPPEDTPIDRS